MQDSALAPAETTLKIPVGLQSLAGDLVRPDRAKGLILFAHGSGSGRHSSRNRHVAHILQEAGFATLLLDLLTAEEERVDIANARYRFDIGLLAERLEEAARFVSTLSGNRGTGNRLLRSEHRGRCRPHHGSRGA